MRALTIDESFMRYVAEPSAELLMSLRQQVFARTDYLPYSPVWQHLDQMISQSQFTQVLEIAPTLKAWAFLSPRWHFWQGVAALEIGDTEEAGYRRQVMQSCLKGLLETGDGTEEQPYLVTYTTDAYDIMRVLGEVSERQMLTELPDGRKCDVLTTADGEEFWFEVTEMFARAHLSRPGKQTERSGETSSRRSRSTTRPRA